jgi:hypothetical protein
MTLIPEDGLGWLVALLRDGRDYYRFAEQETIEPDTREAFHVAADVRSRLLADLVRAGAIDETSAGQPATDIDADNSYAALRRQFDPQLPALQGLALHRREAHVLRLIESVFRANASLPVRAALKRAYPEIKHCAEIMWRLSLRHQAA